MNKILSNNVVSISKDDYRFRKYHHQGYDTEYACIRIMEQDFGWCTRKDCCAFTNLKNKIHVKVVAQ